MEMPDNETLIGMPSFCDEVAVVIGARGESPSLEKWRAAAAEAIGIADLVRREAGETAVSSAWHTFATKYPVCAAYFAPIAPTKTEEAPADESEGVSNTGFQLV